MSGAPSLALRGMLTICGAASCSHFSLRMPAYVLGRFEFVSEPNIQTMLPFSSAAAFGWLHVRFPFG